MPDRIGICPGRVIDESKFPPAVILRPGDEPVCARCGGPLVVYARVPDDA